MTTPVPNGGKMGDGAVACAPRGSLHTDPEGALTPTRLKYSPWPVYDEEQVEAVARVLRSGKVNYLSGGVSTKFEEAFAQSIGVKRAVAIANGTLAIEAALHAAGIQCGDEVVTTPRTFIATAGACVLHGIKPIFADVDPDSGCITAESVERVLTPKTRAILPVHLGGWPCEMDALLSLAQEKNLVLIEDCAQAHGARYKNKPVGSFGLLNAWSFCTDKVMTLGGEGGMVTTDEEGPIWESLWSIKDHGKDFAKYYGPAQAPGFRWVHRSFGSNWRLTEMQCAMGLVQLGRMDEWHRRRTHNAEVLYDRLSECSVLRTPRPGPHLEHAYYRFYAYLRPEALRDGWNLERILGEFEDRGLPCNAGSCSEIYRERAFTDLGLGPERPLPVASQMTDTAIAILVHPTLVADDMHSVADGVLDVLAQAQR